MQQHLILKQSFQQYFFLKNIPRNVDILPLPLIFVARIYAPDWNRS